MLLSKQSRHLLDVSLLEDFVRACTWQRKLPAWIRFYAWFMIARESVLPDTPVTAVTDRQYFLSLYVHADFEVGRNLQLLDE